MKLSKFEIKPHEFKHPITVERLTPGVNEDNIPTETWQPFIKARAKVLNVRGEEYLQAQGIGSSISKTFYIRTQRNKEITNLDRVVYKDVAYNIEYANDIEDAGVITEIKVKLVK